MPPERERLLEAMARCCARNGYEETTVADVLIDARLGSEAFERAFASKEACAVAALESILGESMAVVSGAYSADRSEWDNVLSALKALLELCAARPTFANLAFIGSRQSMPGAALNLYESGFTLWNVMLPRLRSDQLGESEPPEAAARAAIGGGEALVRREVAGGRAEGLPRALPDLVYSATIPFLGQEEALALARRGRQLLEGPSGSRSLSPSAEIETGLPSERERLMEAMTELCAEQGYEETSAEQVAARAGALRRALRRGQGRLRLRRGEPNAGRGDRLGLGLLLARQGGARELSAGHEGDPRTDGGQPLLRPALLHHGAPDG
jgi:AcrR family transcriptional regulator